MQQDRNEWVGNVEDGNISQQVYTWEGFYFLYVSDGDRDDDGCDDVDRDGGYDDVGNDDDGHDDDVGFGVQYFGDDVLYVNADGCYDDASDVLNVDDDVLPLNDDVRDGLQVDGDVCDGGGFYVDDDVLPWNDDRDVDGL